MEIQDILEHAGERLMEDESLRSHLDDRQASLVLNRALAWLENCLKREMRDRATPDVNREVARVVDAMRAINHALDSPDAPPLAALLDEYLPLAERTQPAAIVQNMSLVRRAAARLRLLLRRALGRPKTEG